jgi:hypothetical protein
MLSWCLAQGARIPPGQDLAGPEGWVSWQGMALVIPRGAGAQQGLRGRGPEGQGSLWNVDLVQSWGLPQPKGWGSQRGVDPVIPCEAGAQHGLRSGGPKGQRSRQGMDPAQSWGPARPKGERDWGKGAAAPQAYRAGIWQACCSFMRLWGEEAFHDLEV